MHGDTTFTKHLDLLIDCVKRIYAFTTVCLLLLLKHDEIMYDLLWVLFKPNTLVYITCSEIKKPRCVTYDSAEEKMNRWKMRYFSMNCRYFNFDDIVFSKTFIKLVISKFCETQCINTLSAFSLKYHSDKEQVKSDLINCGQKFVSLIGTHHIYCQGEAFVMYKEEPVTVSVNSRVMIDADFFWKMNLNYFRPCADLAETQIWNAFGGPPSPLPKSVQSEDVEPVKLREDDLIICCLTVLGFSFGKKLWNEFYLTYSDIDIPLTSNAVKFVVINIREIEWSLLSFDCLSISEKQRDVIMALVKAHLDLSVKFDDCIVKKGKGINMLLQYGPMSLIYLNLLTWKSDPPEVEKTLTAEAVSEHLKRPLYSVRFSSHTLLRLVWLFRSLLKNCWSKQQS